MADSPAFSLRCASCGGPAGIDWERGGTLCSHCSAHQPIAEEILARLREHLRRITEHQRDYTQAATERDQLEREHARLGMPLLLRIFFPLFAGLWTVVSLGFGGGAMFAVMPTTQKYLGDELGGLLGAAAFITVYAGSLVSMRLLMVRQRNQLQVLPTSIIVSETCPSCGGGVPVAIGLTSSCPFCEATVVVSGKDQLKIESAVRETVAREKGRARSALRKAAQSGAENAQAILGAISMVSLLPLLFVALPVLVGRAGTLIVGHVLWPASIRDITARNTLEVVSVVVCVVLGITSVVSVVCVAMRKDSKRRKSMGVS